MAMNIGRGTKKLNWEHAAICRNSRVLLQDGVKWAYHKQTAYMATVSRYPFDCCVVFFLLLSISACELIMESLKEQRVCLRFCFPLEKSTTETYQMLQQALQEDAMNCT